MSKESTNDKNRRPPLMPSRKSTRKVCSPNCESTPPQKNPALKLVTSKQLCIPSLFEYTTHTSLLIGKPSSRRFFPTRSFRPLPQQKSQQPRPPRWSQRLLQSPLLLLRCLAIIPRQNISPPSTLRSSLMKSSVTWIDHVDGTRGPMLC